MRSSLQLRHYLYWGSMKIKFGKYAITRDLSGRIFDSPRENVLIFSLKCKQWHLMYSLKRSWLLRLLGNKDFVKYANTGFFSWYLDLRMVFDSPGENVLIDLPFKL